MEARDPDDGLPVIQPPQEITTGCPELDLVWARFAGDIVNRPGVLIADTEDDLNWHAFLGHSIDMQGFRAAEFAGVDPLTRDAPGFVPLRQRDVGVPQLASLWHQEVVREHLLNRIKGKPLQATLDVLRDHGGPVGSSLADAFQYFPFRKGHWTVRALLQNSAALASDGYSFRNWLRRECAALGVTEFPPPNFRQQVRSNGRQVTLEKALRARLEAAFYQVGPALAPYVICDWQLALWAVGKTAVFASFKLDAFHEEFVRRYGRGLMPESQDGFSGWWLDQYPDLPPRLANETIWLGTEHGLV